MGWCYPYEIEQRMVFNTLVYSDTEFQSGFSKKALIDRFLFSLHEIIGKMSQKWCKITKGRAIKC